MKVTTKLTQTMIDKGRSHPLFCPMARSLNSHPDCKNASVEYTDIAVSCRPYDWNRTYFIKPTKAATEFIKSFDFSDRKKPTPGTITMNTLDKTLDYTPEGQHDNSNPTHTTTH